MYSYQTITVEPLTTAIGAVIHGVDATRPLPEGQADEVRRALLDHLVVFLRDQDLTEEQQLAFAANFGRLNPGSIDPRPTANPSMFVNLEDTPDSPPKADRWHTDVPFVPEPPDFAFLNMRITPPVGGDTLWLSLYAVYEGLSPQLQRIIEPLQLDLGLGASAATIKELFGEEYYNEVVVPFTSVHHPLVRVHPETGRRAVYLAGSFMNGLVDLHADESAMLLDLLQSRLDDPNLQVRWKWKAHDLAIWDERCTNHRAMSDHYPAHRLIRRCLAGSGAPIGVGA
jgi:taurine dioxygenase